MIVTSVTTEVMTLVNLEDCILGLCPLKLLTLAHEYINMNMKNNGHKKYRGNTKKSQKSP